MGASCCKPQDLDISAYYTIGEKIGAGAFGQVRDCTHIASKSERAVKIIWKEEQGVTIEELMQELHCMRLMNHDYIVRLYDFFEDDKFLYCVMDKFTGKELFTKLKNTDLKESDFANYVKMMLNAILYLKSCLVVHRDIKPENFLFRDEGEKSDLCMIDFGLSHIMDRDDEDWPEENKQYLSVCCGTVQYLSPEQIKGKYRYECDLWAIGAITYLLCFGRFPFNGSSDTAIMYEILNKSLIFKQATFKKNAMCHVSEDAKHFLQLMMTKDPKQRIRPEDALRHRWITRKGILEDNVIDKNTVKMALAEARSSKRDMSKAEAARDTAIEEKTEKSTRQSVREIGASGVVGNVRKSLAGLTGKSDTGVKSRKSQAARPTVLKRLLVDDDDDEEGTVIKTMIKLRRTQSIGYLENCYQHLNQFQKITAHTSTDATAEKWEAQDTRSRNFMLWMGEQEHTPSLQKIEVPHVITSPRQLSIRVRARARSLITIPSETAMRKKRVHISALIMYMYQVENIRMADRVKNLDIQKLKGFSLKFATSPLKDPSVDLMIRKPEGGRGSIFNNIFKGGNIVSSGDRRSLAVKRGSVLDQLKVIVGEHVVPPTPRTTEVGGKMTTGVVPGDLLAREMNERAQAFRDD